MQNLCSTRVAPNVLANTKNTNINLDLANFKVNGKKSLFFTELPSLLASDGASWENIANFNCNLNPLPPHHTYATFS